MKIRSSHGIALALTGLALAVHAQVVQYPTIFQQPLDQCVPLGSTVSYSVVASNATSYQWLFNGVTMDGETNPSVTIANVDLTSVGYYSAFVFNGGDSVPTRSAALNVYTSGATSSGSATPLMAGAMMAMSSLLSPDGGDTIVVYGLPIANGGGSGTCPGKYAGYVSYLPPTGWGWMTTNSTSYSATDTNLTTTRVQFYGSYGDMGCHQTTVTIPSPAYSPQYRFATYFPSGSQVPTNAYPLLLTGFR